MTVKAKHLAAEMIAQAKETSEGTVENPSGTDEIPSELRKAKVGQVMGLLEREYVSRRDEVISILRRWICSLTSSAGQRL